MSQSLAGCHLWACHLQTASCQQYPGSLKEHVARLRGGGQSRETWQDTVPQGQSEPWEAFWGPSFY